MTDINNPNINMGGGIPPIKRIEATPKTRKNPSEHKDSESQQKRQEAGCKYCAPETVGRSVVKRSAKSIPKDDSIEKDLATAVKYPARVGASDAIFDDVYDKLKKQGVKNAYEEACLAVTEHFDYKV